jgi:hypothetical protein
MCFFLRALLVLALLAFATFLNAQVHVSPDGTDTGDGRNPASPVATVAYALLQANPDEEVRLAVGTYAESGLQITQSQSLTGGWPADFSARPAQVFANNTVIDGEYMGRVFHVGFADAAQEVILDGFRINRGDADASTPSPGHGGGILALGPGTLRLENIRITDSRAKSTRPADPGEDSHAKGGGIYADCSLVISNSTILNNRAHRGALNFRDLATGGGIYYNFLGLPGRTLTIRDSSITANVAQSSQTQTGTATGLGAGGGLALVGADPESGEVAPEAVRIENTRFNFNSGRQNSDPGAGEGGGLYVDMTDTPTALDLQIVASRFESNTAANTPGFTTLGLWTRGGGASLLLNAQSTVTIEDSHIVGNRADAQFVGTVASGGGLYVESFSGSKGESSPMGSLPFKIKIKNTQIRNNRASQGSSTAGGGGIHSSNTQLTIDSCQFSGNGNHNEEPFTPIAGNDGKDLLINGGSLLRVVNSTFSNPQDLQNHLLLAGKGDSVFVSGDVDAEFIHCTFARTTATALAALHFDSDVEALIDSCLVHNFANVARFDGTSNGNLRFNVHTSFAIAIGSFTESNNHAVGTVESADYFVDLAGNNLRLVAGAFPIGKANPSTGVTTDQDENLRDNEPDCGAYEFVPISVEIAVLGEDDTAIEQNQIIDLGTAIIGRAGFEYEFIILAVGENLEAEVNVASIGISPEFQIDVLGPFTVQPGQPGRAIRITRSSEGAPGEILGEVAIVSDAPNAPTFTFQIRATLRPPTPPSLIVLDGVGVPLHPGSTRNLGTTQIGGADLVLPVFYTNDGEADLVIESILTFGEGSFEALPGQGGTAPEGGAVQGSVGHPAVGPAGTFTGEVRINSNDPERPVYSFFVTATIDPAPNPQLQITSEGDIVGEGTNVDVGTFPQGAILHDFTLLVRNVGGETLNVETITIEGDSRITIESAIVTYSIGPGGQRTLGMTLNPTGPPGVANALVRVFSDDPDFPVYTFTLSATIEPPPPPRIAISPSTLDPDIPPGGLF